MSTKSANGYNGYYVYLHGNMVKKTSKSVKSNSAKSKVAVKTRTAVKTSTAAKSKTAKNSTKIKADTLIVNELKSAARASAARRLSK